MARNMRVISCRSRKKFILNDFNETHKSTRKEKKNC